MAIRFLLAALALAGSLGTAQAQSPTALEVYPQDVNLETARDRQSFVVQAWFADGLSREVTAEAKVTVANPALVKLDKNVLQPTADGATEMTVEWGGKAVKVPVKVMAAAVDRPISFKLDVMPVFMRSGCNTGSCHGAARGKDGFRLSLFGFDPDGDHPRLPRETTGRRINRALPAESLVMEKAGGKVPHTGGQRIKEGDEYWTTLIRWLDAGAPLDPPTVAKPVTVEVF